MARLQLGFTRPPKLVLGLLITLFALWVAAALAARTDLGMEVLRLLVLDPMTVLGTYKLWTLVTYPLIGPTDGPFRLLLSLLMIYWFGGELAQRWQTPRFLLFLVLTGAAGGVFATIAGTAGLTGPVLMGPWVWSSAFIVAWGLTFAERQTSLFGLLPLKGIHFVWLAIGMTVLSAISTAANATMVAAEFGAMAMAAALVMGMFKRNKTTLFWDKLLVALRLRKKPNLYVVPKPDKGPGKYDIN